MSDPLYDVMPVPARPIPKAGNIVNYAQTWDKLSTDPWIRNCVRGLTIPFMSLPIQTRVPVPYKMNPQEREFVDAEIVTLLNKQVLAKVEPVEGQWVSNIFLRPKSNGKFRMILDLTVLNNQIEYRHFKMFSLKTAIDLITYGTWMASADLTDAYYSVPITPDHKKFLRFTWKDSLYEYQVLPNGLAPGPRFFTKLLKPVYSYLGELGHVCFPYIDDSFIMGNTKEECQTAVDDTVKLFKSLGFTINEEKSDLTPKLSLEFLGFNINSVDMTVSLTVDKVEKFTGIARHILGQQGPVIRDVAGLIGLMVAYTPGVDFSAVHYKAIERDKILALRRSKGDFDNTMWLSEQGKADIIWWLENLKVSWKIRRTNPDFELFTDASLEGWGAHTDHLNTGGRWNPSELEHINVLELRAILFGLKSLCKEQNKHIRIRTDSTTALAYVKNMGGTRSESCMNETRQIWDWAQSNNCWLSITHIPGILNVLADFKSRCFKQQVEWEIAPAIFQDICKQFGTPDIDLFASRLNHKLPLYVSWEPDPGCWKVDAFAFPWIDMFYYCFPPFRLLPTVIRKLQKDNTRAIVIAPHWTCQPWLALLRRLAVRSVTYPKKPQNLIGQGQLNKSPDVHLVQSTKLSAFLFWPMH